MNRAKHESGYKYPTAWAYTKACRALWKHRARADSAEAENERLREAISAALRMVEVYMPGLEHGASHRSGYHTRNVLPACDLLREALAAGSRTNRESG